MCFDVLHGSLFYDRTSSKCILRNMILYEVIYPIYVCHLVQNSGIWSLTARKKQAFLIAERPKEPLQTRSLGAPYKTPINLCSETKNWNNLREVIKIMKNCWKLRKQRKNTFSHVYSSGKQNKRQKMTFNEF